MNLLKAGPPQMMHRCQAPERIGEPSQLEPAPVIRGAQGTGVHVRSEYSLWPARVDGGAMVRAML